MEDARTLSEKSKLLFIIYFKAMLFAFTGGAVTLPILQDELSRTKLMDKEKVLECYALGQSIPGAISINAGFFVGQEIAGWLGAFATISATILPAFFGMLIISFFYDFLTSNTVVTGAINGIRAASVAVILQIAVNIIKVSAKSRLGVIITITTLVLTFVFKMNIILVVLGSGLVGVVLCYTGRHKGVLK